MTCGTQIVCIPDHAHGNLKHPDVEFGFVTSRRPGRPGCHFCRYWRKGYPGEMRTVANSELTPNRLLVAHRSVEQAVVDEWLRRIGEDAP